jgi:DNA-binding CsgD family transcriptional regulator
MQRREAEELRRLNGGKSAQDSARRLHIRARLHEQNSQQHLADVAILHREAEELRRPNSSRSAQDSARRLHIRAQLHEQNSQQHLADVAILHREAEELRRPNSSRSAQDSARRLHIRARLHEQNSQQHLADGAMWYREATASRYHSGVKRRKATQEEEAVVSEIKHRQKVCVRGFYSDSGFAATLAKHYRAGL